MTTEIAIQIAWYNLLLFAAFSWVLQYVRRSRLVFFSGFCLFIIPFVFYQLAATLSPQGSLPQMVANIGLALNVVCLLSFAVLVFELWGEQADQMKTVEKVLKRHSKK